MSALAPTMEAFFTTRLMAQRRASQHTVAAYRDTFRLLLVFIEEEIDKRPAAFDIEDLDASRISAFLDYLERDRHSTARTRNACLAAIHSLFGFAALRHPEHAGLIERVLAIPPKRFERQIVAFLTDDEVTALLDAPDRGTRLGWRDHALLVTAIETGLRVTELVWLRVGDVVLGAGAHVRCLGKGRKERATPLTASTVEVLRSWITERGGAPSDPVFPTSRGSALSRYGVSAIVERHARTAAARCPSLGAKPPSPHVLRHTAAMRLLHAEVDTTVIALWLGHAGVETTQMYVHADLSLKEKALARVTPIDSVPGRYRAPDELLAFLEAL